MPTTKPTARRSAAPRKRAARQPRTGPLLEQVAFMADHRCFEKGTAFTFRSGVNLLVGDQGCGKSTLLSAIRDYADHAANPGALTADEPVVELVVHSSPLLSFDFERDNPRTKGYFNYDGSGIAFQLQSKFFSHGQTVQALLDGLRESLLPGERPRPKRTVVLLDEPDMALSPRSAHRLARALLEFGERHQVIAAVHSPIVIQSVPDVLSLEHGAWMPSAEFLAAHAQTGGEHAANAAA